MRLQIAESVLAAVLLGAVLVGLGAISWVRVHEGSVPLGLWVTLGFGMLAAVAIGQVLAPRLARRTEAIRALTQRVDALDVRLPEGMDPILASLARAVNRRLTRAQDIADTARLDAAVWRVAVDLSPNGVLLVSSDHHVQTVNAAFRRLCDVRPDDVIGRSLIEVVHLGEVHQAIDGCRTRKEGVEVEARVGRSDLLLRAVPTDNGGVLLLAVDVTGLRMAERARTDFVGNVSHELRTPIATIGGYAQALADDREAMSPEHAQMVDAIARNAHRLDVLFDDLLELSRIEARRGELPVRSEQIAPIVERATVSARDLAEQRGQTFRVDCPPDLAGLANAEALTTIVRNLAINATNYTPDGGSVEVRARRDGAVVRIDVIDSGIGIERVHHERIFERFYRVDVSRSRKVGGTGLGLAIVKHLALASRCRVSMASTPGTGSRFSVALSPA